MSGQLSPDYVIRAAHGGDFDEVRKLTDLAGPGFTSLMLDDATLKARLALSERSFASEVSGPNDERYMLALEHIESGALAGVAAVKATIGAEPPFYNFRILRIAQASHAADRRFDMDVLILVNEFTGSSEVGSLFVKPEHRAGGIGRALAQARYLLIALEPQRFNERVVSELRGVVSADGVSPFWEAIGRHFFRMDFRDADSMSATTDNQFILDLMPKYPIYVDLLPDEARAAIGKVHPDGTAARRLLEAEGFRFDNVVDIFEGGPLVSVSRDAIRTVREAKKLVAVPHEDPPRAGRALIAKADISDFRCVSAAAAAKNDEVRLHPKALAALKVAAGEPVLAWISPNAD
jgi:arginine N-succinyltransferase